MYDAKQDLLDTLRAAPVILEELLYNAPTDHIHIAYGGDEKWSVVQVVQHLWDVEAVALKRLRAMRDEEAPLLAGLSGSETGYHSHDWQTPLEAIKASRKEFVTELAALSDDEWNRTGQHPTRGQVTIRAHATHLAAHDTAHAAQIVQQLQAARQADKSMDDS